MVALDKSFLKRFFVNETIKVFKGIQTGEINALIRGNSPEGLLKLTVLIGVDLLLLTNRITFFNKDSIDLKYTTMNQKYIKYLVLNITTLCLELHS